MAIFTAQKKLRGKREGVLAVQFKPGGIANPLITAESTVKGGRRTLIGKLLLNGVVDLIGIAGGNVVFNLLDLLQILALFQIQARFICRKLWFG